MGTPDRRTLLGGVIAIASLVDQYFEAVDAHCSEGHAKRARGSEMGAMVS